MDENNAGSKILRDGMFHKIYRVNPKCAGLLSHKDLANFHDYLGQILNMLPKETGFSVVLKKKPITDQELEKCLLKEQKDNLNQYRKDVNDQIRSNFPDFKYKYEWYLVINAHETDPEKAMFELEAANIVLSKKQNHFEWTPVDRFDALDLSGVTYQIKDLSSEESDDKLNAVGKIIRTMMLNISYEYTVVLQLEPLSLRQRLDEIKKEKKLISKDINEKRYYASLSVTFSDENKELQKMAADIDFLSICKENDKKPRKIGHKNTIGFLNANQMKKCKSISREDFCSMLPYDIGAVVYQENGIYYGYNKITKEPIVYNRYMSGCPNGLFLGASGYGIPFAVSSEITQNVLKGKKTFVLNDSVYTHTLEHCFNAKVIEPCANQKKNKFYINPLDLYIIDPEGIYDLPVLEKCDFMVALIESFLAQGKVCNAVEVDLIHQVTCDIYKDYMEAMKDRKDENGNPLRIDRSICPTLVDFYNAMSARPEPEAAMIAAIIWPVCFKYETFAHRTNIDDLSSQTIVYDIRYWLGGHEVFCMLCCMEEIWCNALEYQAEQQRKNIFDMVHIYIDNLDYFLMRETSSAVLCSQFKCSRPLGIQFTLVNYNFSSVAENRYGLAILNNAGFINFLNIGSQEGRERLKRLFNFDDEILDFINNPRPGEGLFYNGRNLLPISIGYSNTSKLYKALVSPYSIDKDEEAGQANEAV